MFCRLISRKCSRHALHVPTRRPQHYHLHRASTSIACHHPVVIPPSRYPPRHIAIAMPPKRSYPAPYVPTGTGAFSTSAPATKRARTYTPKPKPAASARPSIPTPRVPTEKLAPLDFAQYAPKPPVEIDPRAAPLARQILQETWGFSSFRLEQEAAIARLISGGSAVVVFPTGGGKSLVYQVPALAFDMFDELQGEEPGRGVTLVVSPLIALMKDQTEALKKRGVKAAALDSSQSKDSVIETYRMLREGELKLL